MPVNLYYTQRVRGFQQESVKYSKESVEICLKRTKHQCPHCGSTDVMIEPLRRCRIRGEPLGFYWKIVLEFTFLRECKMEGFNNKIRWLIKQTYSFRDRKYFKLKIYQLPEVSSKKSLWTSVTNRRWTIFKHDLF